jgi:hypothetical protein
LRFVVLLIFTAWIQNLGVREIRGRVTGPSGAALGGVTILSMPSDEAKSDEDGHFILRASEVATVCSRGLRLNVEVRPMPQCGERSM